MSHNKKSLTVNDYFELYLNTKIKYDRQYHIANMQKYNFSVINQTLIQQIFQYIDQVLFGGKLSEYAKVNHIELQFKVSKSMTKTAGYFFCEYDNINNEQQNIVIGFKISYIFFQNIVDKNIINMDLGVLDVNNKKYLSTTTHEPLLTTMEHEIVHMIMYMTKKHKLNDSHTVKSGHTRVFKRLIYNIFGHYRITHGFSSGDMTIHQSIKDTIMIGSYVRDTKTNNVGYVVMMKNIYVIICNTESIEKNGNIAKKNYINALYKNLVIIDNTNDNPLNIKDMMDRLKIGVTIKLDDKVLKILQVNNTTLKAQNHDNKIWIIPKSRVLDMVII